MLGKAIQDKCRSGDSGHRFTIRMALISLSSMICCTVNSSVLSVIISSWAWQQSITSGHKCSAPLQSSWGCYRLLMAMLSSATDSLTQHVIKDCSQLIYHGRVQTPASRYNIHWHCCSPQWMLQVMTLLKVSTEFRFNFHLFYKDLYFSVESLNVLQ